MNDKKKNTIDDLINDLKKLDFPKKSKNEIEKEILEFFRILEEEDDDDFHFWAITRLTDMGSKIIAKNFSKFVNVLNKNNISSRVKSRILLGLTELKNEKKVIEILENVLINDSNSIIRENAALSLGGMIAKSATDTLIQALLETEKNQEVRKRIAWALSRINTKEAIEALKEALANESQVDMKFEFAYRLFLIEGKEGQGVRDLQKMKEFGELQDWQLFVFEELCNEFEIKEKVEEVKKGVNSVQETTELIRKRVEDQPEITGKELLKIIENQEALIAALQKTIEDLTKQIQEKKLTEQKIDELLRYQRGKLRSEIKINELQQEFVSLLKNKNPIEKGKALEMFCGSFFSEADGLEVTKISCNLESEEIDLVVKNNTRKPYWIQLQSPNIFIECKNWSKPVEADEINKLRMKLFDHQDLVKVGFFIALNGFTKGLTFGKIRSQVSGFVLGVITKKDFEYFFKSEMTILEFLEYILFKSMK